MRGTPPVCLLIASTFFTTASAQSSGAAHLKTGKEIYQAGCAGCHGSEGKGAPQSTTGFEKPETFPDFTRCDQTTPEDDYAWKSVIRDGGPSRGFSQIMPSFSGTLTDEQMDAVIHYLRGFCKAKGWPRGELNLPLALVTEKAYPENEEVMVTALNATGAPGLTTDIIHEQRFGEKNQIEVDVPVSFVHPQPGLWYGGFGDFGLGVKRALFSSLRTGSILSAEGLVSVPTGNYQHGFGAGTPSFETFVAYDQLITARSFVQFQAGGVMPVDTTKTPQSMYLRTALGWSYAQKQGLGRLWTPMVEFVADRTYITGATMDWDVVPEFQVTLSKRQHIRFNTGVRIPATNTAGRQWQVMFYVLWDWQDGKLLKGW